MGKIIQFPVERTQRNAAIKLKSVSDQIDRVILQALHDGANPKEISGILSHRLGTLMKNIDEKSELWDICERVLKKQADI